MPTPDIDWMGLLDELQDSIVKNLKEVGELAAADLNGYGREIAMSLLIAARSGDKKRRKELLHQIEVITEINRIRLNKAAADQINRIVGVAFDVLVRALVLV